MVKGILGSVAAPLAGLLAAFLLPSCAGTPSKATARPPLADPTDARRLWSKQLPGLITDLSATRNGLALLIATVPDADREGDPGGFHSTLLDREGQVVWDRAQPSRVKSQSIADDGSLSVVNTFNEKISALDATGKPLWEVDGGCHPFVLSSRRKVICYHDDDAAPGLAFEVLDWTGKRILSRKVAGDVLALKISPDERAIVVGATQGQILGYDGDFQLALKKKIPGEVIDLSISSGTQPRVLVLSSQPSFGQRLTLLDWSGAVIGESRPAQQFEQVELAPDGESFFAYGNGPRGQVLAFFAAPSISTPLPRSPLTLAEKWTQANPRHADFSSPLLVSERRVIVGVEGIGGGVRETRIQAYDFDGKPLWTVPIRTEEGAYLFSHSLGAQGSFLAVATDDSYLSAFVSSGGSTVPSGGASTVQSSSVQTPAAPASNAPKK